MSTPVVTNKWAGNFDCDFCRRKRLMAEEFSKKALGRFRKDGGKLKCKQCVKDAEGKERAAAAAKRADEDSADGKEKRVCAICGRELPHASFNKNQWSKGEGKSKCRECVENALKEEASREKQTKEAALQAARDRLAAAKAKKNNSQEVLKAASELAALEAEKVTGLKPIKMNRGRAGGRGRGQRGRGQSTPGRTRGRR